MKIATIGTSWITESFIESSKYIDDAGLKGKRIGDAMVSHKHAGFIVNMCNASSNDINDLISYIKNDVYKKYGVMLEEEIIYIE